MFWWFPRKSFSRQGLLSPCPSSLPQPPRTPGFWLSLFHVIFFLGAFVLAASSSWNDIFFFSLSWQIPAELFKTCDTSHYKEQVGTEKRNNLKLWDSSPKIIVTWGETQAGQVAVKQCEPVGRGIHGDRQAEGCQVRGGDWGRRLLWGRVAEGRTGTGEPWWGVRGLHSVDGVFRRD